jgi:CheY-like chemotaxis protein
MEDAMMGTAGPQETILVVEDSPQIRTILDRRLRAAGYAVALAEDGRQGLEAARRLQPDLIITDWMMPVMDGVDMIRAIRQDSDLHSMYVILLTARVSEDDRITGLDSGADEYLVKPWSDQELLARVRVALRIRMLQRELLRAQRREVLLQMAATLGHEINNPLMALSAALQVARLDPPSGRAFLEMLDRCDLQVGRIATVVAALGSLRDPEVTTYLGKTRMLKLGINRAS